MTEADYGPSFEIIAQAGDSKGYSMSAIRAARAGDFEKAGADIRMAQGRLLQAHELQTDMIAKEASGSQVPVNIILVHSQDHLTMAMVAQDLAEELVKLYGQLDSLRREVSALKEAAEKKETVQEG